MSTDETKMERYWRSPEGERHHRRLLDSRYESFRERAKSKKTWKGSSFDLIALTGFPNPDLVFHSTFGASDFILQKESDTGIRQEFSWTTRGDAPDEAIENVLLNLGMIVLDGRVAIGAGVLLPQYPLFTHLPKECTVTTMLTRVGLWLDKSDFIVEEYFPTFIVEIVALTDRDVTAFTSDEDAFYDSCAKGEIDFLDLKRP
jgi:hypothetical protein